MMGRKGVRYAYQKEMRRLVKVEGETELHTKLGSMPNCAASYPTVDSSFSDVMPVAQCRPEQEFDRISEKAFRPF